MQPQDIETQIRKFKSRRQKTRLAHYSFFISLFLTLSVFANGFTLSALFSFLLLLPLNLYFSLESFRLYRKSRSIKERLSHLESSISLLESKFSLRKFISQPSLSFRLTCLLFFVVLFTTFARIRTPSPSVAMSEGGDPTLTMSNQSLTISH